MDQEGCELFGLFREVCLTKQHRATDPEHARAVTAFRLWTPKSMDVRKKFFSRLKQVTQRDFADKDEGWEEATIVSTDQKTAHAVNQVMVQQYAKRTGVPVVAWRLPMADTYERRLGEHSEFLYGTVKDMTGFFAQGAPCSLTANLRSEKGLSNSTQAKLHSPLLSPNKPSPRVDEIHDAASTRPSHLPGTSTILCDCCSATQHYDR